MFCVCSNGEDLFLGKGTNQTVIDLVSDGINDCKDVSAEVCFKYKLCATHEFQWDYGGVAGKVLYVMELKMVRLEVMICFVNEHGLFLD